MSVGALFTETMADMTAREIAAAAKRGAGVLLPIGVMEAHGPHLPTGTDAFIATQLCRLTREYAGPDKELIIAPPTTGASTACSANSPEVSISGRRPRSSCSPM